jgi:cytochrome c
MKKQYIFLALLVGSLGVSMLITSCGKSRNNDTGTEYMPDMYISRAYEPMSQPEEEPNAINPYGMNMRTPPAHTMARGQMSYYYPYEKTPEGYEAAKAQVKMPANMVRTEANLIKGKHHYDINCSPCHGEQGLGDGAVSAKFPPGNIPSYATPRIQTLAEGGMYHTITHGLNLMGSYASVLTPEERWCVIMYVQYLRDQAKKGAGETASAPADSAAKK